MVAVEVTVVGGASPVSTGWGAEFGLESPRFWSS